MKLLRLRDVIAQTGLSKSTIYRMIKLEKFPAPRQVGERAARWPSSEIDKWIASIAVAK